MPTLLSKAPRWWKCSLFEVSTRILEVPCFSGTKLVKGVASRILRDRPMLPRIS